MNTHAPTYTGNAAADAKALADYHRRFVATGLNADIEAAQLMARHRRERRGWYLTLFALGFSVGILISKAFLTTQGAAL